MRFLLLVVVFLFLACSPVVSGQDKHSIEPVPYSEFHSITETLHSTADLPIITPTPIPTFFIAKLKSKPKPTPKPISISKPKLPISQIGHGSAIISGRASYYCSPRYPTCTHGYPLGSMVGAACAKLRNVFPNWRGKYVVVKSGSRSVLVHLVDWCGSKDKVIDLYYAVMVKLGGTGVIPVTIYRK